MRPDWESYFVRAEKERLLEAEKKKKKRRLRLTFAGICLCCVLGAALFSLVRFEMSEYAESSGRQGKQITVCRQCGCRTTSMKNTERGHAVQMTLRWDSGLR